MTFTSVPFDTELHEGQHRVRLRQAISRVVAGLARNVRVAALPRPSVALVEETGPSARRLVGNDSRSASKVAARPCRKPCRRPYAEAAKSRSSRC